jgi:hypothetical protein
MNYPAFVKELSERFGEERGVGMAIRAEIGFLRRYLEERDGKIFLEKQEAMIEDFLNRHPAK